MFRDWSILIDDIIESINKIKKYIEKFTFEDFVLDSKTIDAVVRNLEIISEASNRIPDDIKTKISEIEWKKIVGLRNRIIHEYFGVDNGIIWFIVKNELDNLEYNLMKFKNNIETS